MGGLMDLRGDTRSESLHNMNEISLSWKLSPERTLPTEAGSSGKKSKDRGSEYPKRVKPEGVSDY